MDSECSLLLSLPLDLPRCKLREYRQKEKNTGKYQNHVYRTYMCTIDPGTLVRMYILFLGGKSENFNQAADTQEPPHPTALCVKTFVVMLQIVFLLIGAEEITKGSGGQGFF